MKLFSRLNRNCHTAINKCRVMFKDALITVKKQICRLCKVATTERISVLASVALIVVSVKMCDVTDRATKTQQMMFTYQQIQKTNSNLELGYRIRQELLANRSVFQMMIQSTYEKGFYSGYFTNMLQYTYTEIALSDPDFGNKELIEQLQLYKTTLGVLEANIEAHRESIIEDDFDRMKLYGESVLFISNLLVTCIEDTSKPKVNYCVHKLLLNNLDPYIFETHRQRDSLQAVYYN